MTTFITGLTKPFLVYMNQSLIDYEPLCGLIRLILVSMSQCQITFL
jgi:hypothetical protein